MWNIIGIISGVFFLWASPEITRDATGNMTSNLDEKIECSTLESLDYCHIYSQNNSSQEVLYYFHSEFDNEKSWLYSKENIEFRKLLAERQKPRPHVISISLGVLTSIKQTDPTQQPLPFDLQRLENVLNINASKRFLYGKNLGAYNVLQISFLNEKINLKIDGLILACPFIPELDPFLDPRSQLSYAVENGLDPFRFFVVQSYQRLYFKNSKEWSESSPVSVLKSKDFKTFPKTLLVVGDDTGFHFLSSSNFLAAIAKEKMLNLNLKQKPGHQCLADSQDILEFIQN